MSAPDTPERHDSDGAGVGDVDDSDPLLHTIKAASKQHQYQQHRQDTSSPLGVHNNNNVRPNSPLSFKKRTPSSTPAVPFGSAAGRSLSNFFSRRPSGRSNPPTKSLSMPPAPDFENAGIANTSSGSNGNIGGVGGLRSPGALSYNSQQATPTTNRRVSGVSRGASRKPSMRGRENRIPRTRTFSPVQSPGGTSHQAAAGGLGRRIQDWRRTTSSDIRSPSREMGDHYNGSGDDEDEDREEQYGSDAGSNDLDDDFEDDRGENEPIVPKMLPELRTPEHQTPLPKLPIIVLAICMVGEFLSASVGGPFLFFMLEDLGVPGGGGESAVGQWAGIVSAAFFLTQFATALLWASAAARYGRRTVLFVSLLGNTLMLLMYGTCRSVILMVIIRLFQGAFNGAVGVARSAVKDITDSTNEGRAYSIVGVAWSLGGILGPSIGGWTEHPVENLPRLFGNSQIFSSYPYLLPCALAASVTGTGCVLSLFLSYDAGPPQGGIRLPEEKDVERAVHKVASFSGSVKKKVSGYFAQTGSTSQQPRDVTDSPGRLTIADRSEVGGSRLRKSFALPHRGSAYGYDARRRDTALSRFRKMSTATSTRYAPDYEGYDYEPAPLNFAQKLLLANDEAGVFNITDLWVAAATREDGLPYTSANLEEDVFDEEDESMAVGDETRENDRDPFSDETSILGVNPSVSRLRRDSLAATSVATGRQGGSPHRPSNRSGVLRNRANSSVSHVGRPAIYQNTGLSRSPVTSPAPRRESAGQPYLDQPYIQAPAAISPGLAAIPEGKLATDSGLLTVPGAADADITSMSRDPSPGLETKEKDPLQDFSILRDLPIALIAQYSLLALHGTIMDQVFMSFLVSKTAAGGLGLEASDFADIIACMCFFQMLFQFRFYPTVSMPLGRLTHVQMFRLGLVLYLVPYILFPELRPLLGPGGVRTGTVTFGLILLTATRYLANTCSYTAVMILINAMTPPAYIPMANGLAQSVVSLARFIGPLSGGTIWAKSIANGPEGYYVGFAVCAAICFAGLLHSFTIR